MLCGICLAAYFTIKYFSFDFLVKNWKGIFSTIFMFLILVVILTDRTSLNTIGGISSWGFKYRTKWIGKKNAFNWTDIKSVNCFSPSWMPLKIIWINVITSSGYFSFNIGFFWSNYKKALKLIASKVDRSKFDTKTKQIVNKYNF